MRASAGLADAPVLRVPHTRHRAIAGRRGVAVVDRRRGLSRPRPQTDVIERIKGLYPAFAMLTLLVADHGAVFVVPPLLALTGVGLFIATPPAHRHRAVVPYGLIGFAGWAVLTMLWTENIATTQSRLIDLATMAMIGWFMATLVPLDRMLRSAAWGMKAIISVTVATALLFPHWANVPRFDVSIGWHGPFNHKNELGFFAWVTIVTVVIERGRWWGFWAALAAVALVGSSSSTAAASLVLIGCIALLGSVLRRLRSDRQRIVVFSFAGILVVVAGMALLFDVGLLAGAFGRDVTFTGRTTIWRAAARSIGQRPLTGHGFGGVWDELGPTSTSVMRAVGARVYHAHNGFLDVTLQTGVIGLVLLLGSIGTALWRARPYFRRNRFLLWPATILVGMLFSASAESAPFMFGGYALTVAMVTALLTGTTRAGALNGSTYLRVHRSSSRRTN